MKSTRIHRRHFLRTASAAAAGLSLPCLIPSHVLSGPDRPGANGLVNVAVIGCGGRARSIANTCKDVSTIRIVAVCDCEFPRAERFAKDLSGDAKLRVYQEFREMIGKEKLDGVMIETTTHARAWIAVQAMQAGLDAYIEKPMCLTIAEGRAMVKAARKFNRVTQIGTQQRSMPINNWASDLVKNGAIGKILTVTAPNYCGPERWTKTSSGGVSKPAAWWDMWTNQAELRPYDPDIHHGWARWRDYDNGGLNFGLTGWGAHSYDQINRALGTDHTGPVEVTLDEPMAMRDAGKLARAQTVGGTRFRDTGDIIDAATGVVSGDTGAAWRLETQLRGPRAKTTMKFANGTEVKFHLDGNRGPGLGAIFAGEKGKIEINRNRIASNPKEIVRSPDNPGPIKRPETSYHIENWVECVKSRNTCNADIEIGQRASTLCLLVSIAREIGRVGEALKWDPDAERFSNCDEANTLLSRSRRKGYELPEIG